MWRERSNTCVHDLWPRRVLRDHKRSRPCTFEVERPPAHTPASDIAEFVHVVLRLQCVRDEPGLITARRNFGVARFERFVLKIILRCPTILQPGRCSKRCSKDSDNLARKWPGYALLSAQFQRTKTNLRPNKISSPPSRISWTLGLRRLLVKCETGSMITTA